MWLEDILGLSLWTVTVPVCKGPRKKIGRDNRWVRNVRLSYLENLVPPLIIIQPWPYNMNQEDEEEMSRYSANSSLGENKTKTKRRRCWAKSASVLFQDAQKKSRVYTDIQRKLICKMIGWILFLENYLNISATHYCCAQRDSFSNLKLLQMRFATKFKHVVIFVLLLRDLSALKSRYRSETNSTNGLLAF